MDLLNVEYLLRVFLIFVRIGGLLVAAPFFNHPTIPIRLKVFIAIMLAYALVHQLSHMNDHEEIFRYAAGGFRDFTRIASSDPQMWHDIMCTNQTAIVEAIDLFQNNLTNLRQAIIDQDSERLLKIFNRAKMARDEFAAFIGHQKDS